MRALAVTPGSTYGLSWREVADPVPAPGEALIEVRNSSLNFGDLSSAPGGAPGTVPGWDAAGVVLAAAEDGSGPKAGDRVVSFSYANGAWAAKRAVATADLAVVPEKVDLAVAAALPVAGVTALRALRVSGALLGRRVLITGASGGVGRYAVQLAALGGAHVIAAANRGAGLAELGAHEVVSTLDGLEPVDVVLDNVGGRQLVQAWGLVKTGGVVQSIGWTSGEPAEFPAYSTVGPAKSLTSFQAGVDFGPDLTALLELVEDGRLKVDIGWRGSWSRFEEAAKALLGRQVTGKAVLDHD
ncbi:zinc-binding dehydrogenase [Pseudonocardia eucalypti]|uniref:Zinc-binding dehydrogenase n=1 Tax=Pseudonocardia eucalypti TaxID=648755 RepID=A0ABP9Q6F1_9PSEU|nr:NADPH:quinone reductase-like Zn-dependent oxidoreductase [Pseudonocardia eucalypti]